MSLVTRADAVSTSFTVIVSVSIQPKASLTVIVYIPGATLKVSNEAPVGATPVLTE
ncbi:hypothetical protein D3C87_2127580 [compost metagenome]